MQYMFVVPGEPRGKGRPRFSKKKTYTDHETAAYERKVVECFVSTAGSHRAPDTAFLTVDIIAYLEIPKSATKKRASAMERKEIIPSRKPDVDNVIKIVLDALNGVAYKDDSRVHSASCVKYYSFEPRIEVYIKEI